MRITLTNIELQAPTSGNQVIHLQWRKASEDDSEYRNLPDATINPSGDIISPSPYQFNTEGTVIEDIWVKAISDCNAEYGIIKVFDGINMCCPATYTLSPDGKQCSKTETTPATVTQAGVCVACSKLSPEYGGLGVKFWSTNNYDLNLTNGNFTLLSTAFWIGNPPGSGSTAPCGDSTPVTGNPPSIVNRHGVWVDTNCDGTKNALVGGASLQFTWLINSDTAKRVFVGVAGDNNFVINHNGTIVAQRTSNGDPNNFKFCYLFPLDLISGSNFINARFVGDGSVNDMGCLFIIENDAASIPGITDDADMDYLFKTSQMIGADPVDIASCPAGYTLDTSGGSGNYECVKITTVNSTVC